MEDSFIELQAILAGLPIHAVPSPEFSRSCGPDVFVQCSGQRGRFGRSTERHCMNRIEDRLQEVWEDYPEHQEVLGRLRVEHANLDMVCVADHVEKRLFTAARGTDRNVNPLTTPRDWSNNMRILLGFDLGRTAEIVESYKAVRERFPGYSSYGSGHSLGGAVILHLAKAVEADPQLMFARLDVFNTAVSPLTRSLVVLSRTAFHAHRVDGDWASWGITLSPPPATVAVHTHPVKPHVRERHALGHFLPDKAGCSTPSIASGELSPADSSVSGSPPAEKRLSSSVWLLGVLSCVGVRNKRPPELCNGALAPPEAQQPRTPLAADPKLKLPEEPADADKARPCLAADDVNEIKKPANPPAAPGVPPAAAVAAADGEAQEALAPAPAKELRLQEPAAADEAPRVAGRLCSAEWLRARPQAEPAPAAASAAEAEPVPAADEAAQRPQAWALADELLVSATVAAEEASAPPAAAEAQPPAAAAEEGEGGEEADHPLASALCERQPLSSPAAAEEARQPVLRDADEVDHFLRYAVAGRAHLPLAPAQPPLSMAVACDQPVAMVAS